MVELGKFGRENESAQTFESHCANWHKSCGIRRTKENQTGSHIYKKNVLANEAINIHEVFSRSKDVWVIDQV